MPRQLRLVTLIALSAVWAAPAVAGEIFKCVAKDGIPLYQNFPCNIDSVGSAPSNPTASKTSPEKPKAESVAAVSAALAKPAEISIGMTLDDVRAFMGEPEEMIEDEPGVGGRVMNWRYADGIAVQFDHKHRVVGVQR